MMKTHMKASMVIFGLTTFSILTLPILSHYTDESLINVAQAKDDHDSHSSSSGHKGKGPKYKGGRGAEGHAASG